MAIVLSLVFFEVYKNYAYKQIDSEKKKQKEDRMYQIMLMQKELLQENNKLIKQIHSELKQINYNQEIYSKNIKSFDAKICKLNEIVEDLRRPGIDGCC